MIKVAEIRLYCRLLCLFAVWRILQKRNVLIYSNLIEIRHGTVDFISQPIQFETAYNYFPVNELIWKQTLSLAVARVALPRCHPSNIKYSTKLTADYQIRFRLFIESNNAPLWQSNWSSTCQILVGMFWFFAQNGQFNVLWLSHRTIPSQRISHSNALVYKLNWFGNGVIFFEGFQLENSIFEDNRSDM